jgi:hypothetical protein
MNFSTRFIEARYCNRHNYPLALIASSFIFKSLEEIDECGLVVRRVFNAYAFGGGCHTNPAGETVALMVIIGS